MSSILDLLQLSDRRFRLSPELQLPLKMKGFRFYYGRNIDLDGKLFI